MTDMTTHDAAGLVEPEDVHVLPIGDLREHSQSADCWCCPKRDDEEPRVVIHNSMDRREEYERGRAKH